MEQDTLEFDGRRDPANENHLNLGGMRFGGGDGDTDLAFNVLGSDGVMRDAMVVHANGAVTFDWFAIEDAAGRTDLGPLGFFFTALLAARGARP